MQPQVSDYSLQPSQSFFCSFPDYASFLPCSPFAAPTPQRLAGAHDQMRVASCRDFLSITCIQIVKFCDINWDHKLVGRSARRQSTQVIPTIKESGKKLFPLAFLNSLKNIPLFLQVLQALCHTDTTVFPQVSNSAEFVNSWLRQVSVTPPFPDCPELTQYCLTRTPFLT